MKEPWFNISPTKILTVLGIVGAILNQLRMTDIPENYKQWIELAVGILAAFVALLVNPKDKRWVSDEQAEAEAVAAERLATSNWSQPAPRVRQLSAAELRAAELRAELQKLEEGTQ
jgi:hypothetical protein